MRFFSIATAILCVALTTGKKEKETASHNTSSNFEQPVIVEIQNVSSGFLQTITFPSKHIGKRNVYVWTPSDYHNTKEKYAVLYMHDGQMLFDAKKTWNKQEWGVDEALSKLIKAKKVKNTIVVGIWNHSDIRHSEYFPQKALNPLTKKQKEAILKNQNKKR